MPLNYAILMKSKYFIWKAANGGQLSFPLKMFTKLNIIQEMFQLIRTELFQERVEEVRIRIFSPILCAFKIRLSF